MSHPYIAILSAVGWILLYGAIRQRYYFKKQRKCNN
jgi:hypothetical protein